MPSCEFLWHMCFRALKHFRALDSRATTQEENVTVLGSLHQNTITSVQTAANCHDWPWWPSLSVNMSAYKCQIKRGGRPHCHKSNKEHFIVLFAIL